MCPGLINFMITCGLKYKYYAIGQKTKKNKNEIKRMSEFITQSREIYLVKMCINIKIIADNCEIMDRGPELGCVS